MTLAIRIDSGGTLEALDKRVARLAGMDVHQLLLGIGAEVESQTRRRIQEEKRSPEGVDWEPLKESTVKQYTRLGRSTGRQALLELTGELLDSIESQVSGDAVYVGSNKEYARVHQLGSEDGSIVSREYLGISDENQLDLEKLVVDFVEDLLR